MTLRTPRNAAGPVVAAADYLRKIRLFANDLIDMSEWRAKEAASGQIESGRFKLATSTVRKRVTVLVHATSSVAAEVARPQAPLTADPTKARRVSTCVLSRVKSAVAGLPGELVRMSCKGVDPRAASVR